MKNFNRNKRSVISNLEEVIPLLQIALVEIININKETQFDYVTDTNISNLMDRIVLLTKGLDKVVYQKI